METLKLAIKFVKQSSPTPVPEPSPTPTPISTGGGNAGIDSNYFASLSQTGDLATTVLIIFAVLAFLIAGAAALAIIKFGRLSKLSNSKTMLKGLISSRLYKKLQQIRAGIIAVPTTICLVCCCFTPIAHADNINNNLVVSKDTINAVVGNDGIITFDTCTLTNTSTENINIDKVKINITDEAKEIQGLTNCWITASAFGGVMFDGNPNDNAYTPTGLTSLRANENTTLSINIKDLDNSILEQLIDKNIFTITLIPKIVFPHYSKLEDYTWQELQTVSNAISNGTIPGDEYSHFEKFAREGQTKTLTLGAHDTVSADYLYMRIIGLAQDTRADNGKKAGLTFMAANSINQGYSYDNPENSTTENWAKCQLRTRMNSTDGDIYNLINRALGSVSPVKVKKTYSKAYEGGASSYSTEQAISEDTYFLPSYSEITGDTNSFGDEGLQGSIKKYTYISNDIWKQLDTKWHGSYPGPVMNDINWNGYKWLQESDEGKAKQQELIGSAMTNLPETYWVFNCGQRYFNAERSVINAPNCSVVFDYDGKALDGCPINTRICVAPCFCL